MERGASLALQPIEPMNPAMTPERYQQINRLFHEALDQARDHRTDYLKQACGDDGSLRVEVERMLAAHEQAGGFLGAPAVAAFAHTLVEQPDDRRDDSLIGLGIGRYRVLSKLGEGGMGAVYLAQDVFLERRVALKLLPEEFTSDRDRVRRFIQEARAASALNHPNIVTIYEIGQAQIEARDLHFIVQEFIDGRALRDRIREGGFSCSEALAVILQAARALEVAHAAGVIHRDIKPENIMLRPDGVVKILDFGLAKLIEPVEVNEAASGSKGEDSGSILNRTAPGMILGTAAYMSPEQARGLKVDARTDVWSLGVVLYEMLTGQAPFTGMTMTDVLISVVEREPPPLSARLPAAPPALDRILRKALAKNRDERCQSVRDLGEELKELKKRLEFDAEKANEPVRMKGHAARGSIFSSRPLSIAAIFLFALAAIFFVRSAWRPKPSTPAPGRQISYSLTVQKTREGREYEAAFESAGQEAFESGWKFRLNFQSARSGYLYLLNEGPAADGAESYSLLFPSPSINNGSARVAAAQPIRTGWYQFGDHKGTERLWLVSAPQAVDELEAVKGVVNPKDKGVISGPAKLESIREFLNRSASSTSEVRIDSQTHRTEITSRSELLLHLLKLEHR